MPLLADSATWVAVALAIGAAVLAVGLSTAIVVHLARLRGGRAADDDVRNGSISRTESMVAELTGALAEARRENRQSRRLAEIATTIDIDGVLERTLAAATELPGVNAAMIALLDDDEPVVAGAGMTADEAARQPVSRPPGGSARPVRFDYRYERAEEEADSKLIRGGLAVALRDAQDEPIGTLAVFWRGAARAATDEELAELEELAAGCGPAVENAQRFRKVRHLADVDALTSLRNRRYFDEMLARERARADRYERRLSLILVDVDDFKAINDRLGNVAGDAVLAAVAERLRSTLRRADVACRVGGDEFAVVVPEAGLADAAQLYRRIQFAVASNSIEPADRVHISAGIVELRPEDDAVSLFQRADEALYRAKEAG